MGLFAAALAAILLAVPVGAGTEHLARISIEFDLDSDGVRESIVLDRSKDSTLSVRHGRRVMWEGLPAHWEPWKLLIADVDGDGQREIVVGVHKATRYFPKPHNCLFVYGWDGKRVFPKWLGSSLSKPFSDFAFADLNGDRQKELIALETRRDGFKSVGVYSWNGFGFTLEWERGRWSTAELRVDRSGEITIDADGEIVPLK